MGMYSIKCPSCGTIHAWFGGLDQRCTQCKSVGEALKVLPGDLDNGQVFDGKRWHQLYPREAVEGDIGNWLDAQRGLRLTPENAESEERSIYHSSTDGRIPLSFKGRHLLQNLRFATSQAIQECFVPSQATYTVHDALSLARAAVARRMGELEARARDSADYSAGYAQQREKVETLERELIAMRAEVERRVENIDELERKLKMYEPVSQYNGLSIEEWRTAALKAESELRVEKSIRTVYERAASRRLKTIDGLRAEVKVRDGFIVLLQQRIRAYGEQLYPSSGRAK
jgi:hypothetical protein